MKAVILAAGIGSRLAPITDEKPKCLVTVGGRPILEHQLMAFRAAGIPEVIVIVGHLEEEVRRCLDRTDATGVRVVRNPDFRHTNNMYSLYLARDLIGAEEFVLANGDVVWEPSVVSGLLRADGTDLIAVDRSSYSAESMKVAVCPDLGVVDIGKQLDRASAYANAVDLYRFSARGAEALFRRIREVVEDEGDRKAWTEVAIGSAIRSGRLRMQPFDIGGRRWVEIDDLDDLAVADRMFAKLDWRSNGKKLCFIDLDGTFYVGDRLVPGAREWLRQLESAEIRYYFLSNNSSRSKQDYVRRLRGLGIEASERDIVLSTDALIEHLQKEGIRSAYVLGTESLQGALAAAGIDPLGTDPESVVVGYDTELTYEKLRRAVIYLNTGCPYFATHSDLLCPAVDGLIPDAGCLLALLEAATGRRPDRVFGKPNPAIVAHLLAEHGVAPGQVMVVGDRLYTDFELADRLGCDFILVLTGETRREDVERLDRGPALIVSDLSDLIQPPHG